MSSTEPSAKPPRTRARKESDTKTSKKPKAPAKTPPRMVSSDERRSMIAEAAYLRAERRGFQGGDPIADWLDSEREVDALLSRGGAA
jgi:Protein of unknown function (DUF2934)